MTESRRGTVSRQRSLLFRSAAREFRVASAANYRTIRDRAKVDLSLSRITQILG